jgi:hypothetical protein
MKQITLQIPQNKYQFFMELFRQLGIEVIEEMEIPEKHKAIVRERIKTTRPEELIPWDEARKQFRFKDK